MISFEKLFKNHFNSEKVTYNDLKKFSEDHLARLIANPGTDRIKELTAPTGAAHTAYFGAISNQDVAIAVREGMTLAVDQQIDNFKALIRRKAGAITNAFGEESPQYQEFFPQGLSEYSSATKATIELLMRRVVSAGLTHEREIGGDFVNAFSEIYNQYQTLREAQLQKKGDVSDLAEARDDARRALTTQLTANIHLIAHTYPGNVAQCTAYFDESILRNTSEDQEDDAAPQP